MLDRHRVEPVGIGEVFVTAGQSNSANHGNPALIPADPRVSVVNADDPLAGLAESVGYVRGVLAGMQS